MTFHSLPVPEYDVIIAGGGPVGLFLACELALGRCSVLVLEKAADPSSMLKRLPFGLRGLTIPSIEALDRRGLLGELTLHQSLKDPHAHVEPGPRRQLGHFAGIPLHAGNVDTTRWPDRLTGSTPPSLLTEMEELEMALASRAEALGVVMERGISVTGFHADEHAVTVLSETRSFRAGWLVGCDGSRSVVRRLGGFTFDGTEPEFTGYSAHVSIEDGGRLLPGRNVTATGMYLQSQPGFLAIQEFDGGAFHDAHQPLTREHLERVLRRVSNTSVTLSALHTATTWTDRARQATTYRDGRVLLAGDAAHIHAPLGGQGLNLGLGDAMNLGWKLAATVHGRAPLGLLDTYVAERHPVGSRVLDWSRAQVAAMRPDAGARALYSILRELIDTPDGTSQIAARLWGLNTRYDVGNDHPCAGRSAPNFTLADGTTLFTHLHAGRAILLDFEDDHVRRGWAAAYSGSLDYIASPAVEQLGLRALLVRPDGVIAWAAGDRPDRPSLDEAASRWLPPAIGATA